MPERRSAPPGLGPRRGYGNADMNGYDDPVELAMRVGGGPLLCCVDFDGTLAPIAPTPDAAAPLPGVATVLSELALLPRVRVAIVTGRTVEDIRTRLEVASAYYLGVHGLERQCPGEPLTVPLDLDAVRTGIADIRRRLLDRVGGLRGVLIEDKGLALACHYRLASERDGDTMRALAEEEAEAAQREGLALRVVYGHEVVEIRPERGDKGSAVLTLLEPGEEAVYVGDDETDEDAFRRLPAAAVTVRVGPLEKPTWARCRLEGPEAVLTFLCALLARRREVVV